MGFGQVNYMFSDSVWLYATVSLFRNLSAAEELSLSSLQPLFKLNLLDLAGELVDEHELDWKWSSLYLYSSKDASLVRTLNDRHPLNKTKPRVRGYHMMFTWQYWMGVYALRTLVRLEGALTADDLREWDADGAPLPHLLFYCLGISLDSGVLPLGEMMAWRLLIEELVVAGADFHARRSFNGKRNLTPFLYAVRGVSEKDLLWPRPRHYHKSRPFRLSIRTIVETLSGCGLDLDAFGAMEDFGRRRKYGVNIRFRTSHQVMKLEKIHYGTNVEDWRLEWGFKLSNEDLVGDFWQMVETPTQSMPGAWPESEFDLYSDTDSDTDSYIYGDW